MNIVRTSLDAIRAALHAEFPTYIIYVNDVPQEFARPSFYVALIGAPGSPLSSDLRSVRPSWQLVYFPPLLNTGALTVNMFDVYEMHDKLLTLFGEPYYLRAPSGKAFYIESFDGAPRDGAGYYTLRLDAQHKVQRPVGKPIRDVALTINMKE